MTYPYFSRNGELLPSEQAVVALDDIAYAYGFGVYETIRVTKGVSYFAEEHLERLLGSAKIIGLDHGFDQAFLQKAVYDLVAKNAVEACNIKLLLIGGQTVDDATLYVQCHSPLFPQRSLYKKGAHFITVNYERLYPQAKSLNMMASYMAYRDARKAEAYDALLVNREGQIYEGSRTNFFAMSGRMIYSPPEAEILLGVTRTVVLKVAQENGYEILERAIYLNDLNNFDAAFVTSTSTRIVPAATIGDHAFEEISTPLKELMQLVNDYIDNSGGKLA